MWRIESRTGETWVQYDQGVVSTSDPLTSAKMREDAGRPVQVAPMAQIYTPTGPHDAVGLYLLAAQIVGGGQVTVTGQIPDLPVPVISAPPGAVS